MSTTISIRCSECGTITHDSDYCSACGNIINVSLKRRMAQEEKDQQKLEEKRKEKPRVWSTLANRALDHPNVFVRYLSKAVYAVWAFFGMLIGALIAAIIGIVSG